MEQKFLSRRRLATTLRIVGVVAVAGSHAASAAPTGGEQGGHCSDEASGHSAARRLCQGDHRRWIRMCHPAAQDRRRGRAVFRNVRPREKHFDDPGVEPDAEGTEQHLLHDRWSGRDRDSSAEGVRHPGPHHWVLVHELGHWWQACRKVADDSRHYAREFGANRIAAAYWREHDQSLVRHMQTTFEGILSHSPSPVPAGSDAKSYFDTNYEQLGPTPAYIWFQSQMVIAAFSETPVPTFTQALRETAP